MCANVKTGIKKVKKIRLDVVQNYPQYLNSVCILLHTKKLLLGISSSFEIKTMIANERRSGFIELNKEGFLILITSLNHISEKIKTQAKFRQELTPRYLLKVYVKNSVVRVSIKDLQIETSIIFSSEEFLKLCEFQSFLFHHVMKFTMNVQTVLNIYQRFIQKCVEKNLNDVSTLEVSEITMPESNTNLDLTRILYEFSPILGVSKIQKDMEMFRFTQMLQF